MATLSSPPPAVGKNGAKQSSASSTPVPLTLSGMAHIPMGLPEGIAGGLTQVIYHSIMSCLHFALATRPPFQWSVHDLVTSPYAFAISPTDSADDGFANIPVDLTKVGFTHLYTRRALIYLKTSKDVDDCLLPSHEAELGCIKDPNGGWTSQENVLGCVSLFYATKGDLTEQQIQALNSQSKASQPEIGANKNNKSKKKQEDKPTSPLPPSVLLQAVVESRSVPPTGSTTAVKAEIASMTTVGGSVDDDVKYGALEALHDRTGKYVLDIFSVRGKRYTFDLQEKEASVLPKSPPANDKIKSPQPPVATGNHNSPATKSLCVTVTNHNEFQIVQLPPPAAAVQETSDKSNEKDNGTKVKTGKRKKSQDEGSDEEDDEDDQYDEGEDIIDQSTKCRMCFTLQGALRTEKLESLPSISDLCNELQSTFLSLRTTSPKVAKALPSQQTLLLDPQEAGRVYLHGRYVTTWGRNVSHLPALFGMDLIGIPYWHGQICDYDMVKQAYGQMWQDVLTDARLMPMNIGGMLLSRLKTGSDLEKNGDVSAEDVEIDDDDDDDDEDMDADFDEEDEATPTVNVNLECLESQVMQSLKYDPVGLSAKALATKFKMLYGPDAFPCQAHETDWVRTKLPGWRAVVVPLRVIQVLRRGGYFDVQRSSDDIWFATSRQAKPGVELELVESALNELGAAGLPNLKPTHVVFIDSLKLKDPIGSDGLVRYNPILQQYHVNEQLVTVELQGVGGSPDQRASLLALEIAKCCLDRTVLTRYLLRSSK